MGNANKVRSFLLILVTVFGRLTLARSLVPRTCSRPLPPENAKVAFIECEGNSQCNQGHGVDIYQEYDRVHFSCKEGFKLVSALPYYKDTMPVTCVSNGKWFPKIEQLGKCVSVISFNECDSANWFRCKKSGKCISKDKRCDCDVDCDDGSDEKNCSHRHKLIMAHLNGKESSGIISSPGYPRPKEYPKEYNCIYNITTLPDNYIQIDFEEFDLPKKQNKKCVDSVRLLSVHLEFLQKRRKRQRNKLLSIDNPPRTSQTKCGAKGFRRIYSYSTHISINVTLGYTGLTKPYRGFSMSWQVKSKRDFYQALHKMREKNDKELNVVSPQSTSESSDDDDTMSTIVLPIALCGMLPLSFLAFFLCRRVAKQLLIDKSEPNCPPNKSKSSESTSFTLTENNLAKFSEQMGTVPHTGSRLLPPPVGNSNPSNHFQPLLHNKQISCNSSQNSDLPRYIMSYDIPITHSSTRHSSHSSHRHSPQNGHGPSNSPCPVRNPSPTSTIPQCNNNLKTNHSSRHYSHEHVNSPHDVGMQSTCSSQSTNTCSLCHQGRRICNAEKNNYLQHHQTTLRHSDYYSQPSMSGEEVEEVYVPVSRHHYLTDTYPHLNESEQLREYKEEEHYLHNQPYLHTNHTQQNHIQTYNRNNSSSNMQPDINYSDGGGRVDDIWLPHLHRVEKRKVIYLEEVCDTQSRYISGSDELYGTYNIDMDRGGSLLCTH